MANARSPILLLIVGFGLVSCQGKRGSVPQLSAHHDSPAPTTSSSTKSRCLNLPESKPTKEGNLVRKNSDGSSKVLPPSANTQPGKTVLFRYDNFGPPAMQLGLLGSEWWSWEPGGSYEVDDQFDVRVVVYQGTSQNEVAQKFPTIKDKSDHRLIEREKALRYLDEQIVDLRRRDLLADSYDWRPIIHELETTRSIIAECLPSPATP